MGNVPGKVLNPVGCGDSMVAGFVKSYSKLTTINMFEYLACLRKCNSLLSGSSLINMTIDKMLESRTTKIRKG